MKIVFETNIDYRNHDLSGLADNIIAMINSIGECAGNIELVREQGENFQARYKDGSIILCEGLGVNEDHKNITTRLMLCEGEIDPFPYAATQAKEHDTPEEMKYFRSIGHQVENITEEVTQKPS